jgi:hypothetical protein
VIEVVDYRLDAVRTWGTGPDGQPFEWRRDIVKFRIMEPQSYAGTEGEVMLSSAFTEDQLANVPRAGERRQVRIDSEALAAIIEKRDRKLVDGDPPFQAFRYFFMLPETGK